MYRNRSVASYLGACPLTTFFIAQFTCFATKMRHAIASDDIPILVIGRRGENHLMLTYARRRAQRYDANDKSAVAKE